MNNATSCPGFVTGSLSRLILSRSVLRGVPYILDAAANAVPDVRADTATF
jgi:hypothetical protein